MASNLKARLDALESFSPDKQAVNLIVMNRGESSKDALIRSGLNPENPDCGLRIFVRFVSPDDPERKQICR